MSCPVDSTEERATIKVKEEFIHSQQRAGLLVFLFSLSFFGGLH
jgi:hypothetical protein